MALALTIREVDGKRDNLVLATSDPTVIAAVRRAIDRRLEQSDKKVTSSLTDEK